MKYFLVALLASLLLIDLVSAAAMLPSHHEREQAKHGAKSKKPVELHDIHLEEHKEHHDEHHSTPPPRDQTPAGWTKETAEAVLKAANEAVKKEAGTGDQFFAFAKSNLVTAGSLGGKKPTVHPDWAHFTNKKLVRDKFYLPSEPKAKNKDKDKMKIDYNIPAGADTAILRFTTLSTQRVDMLRTLVAQHPNVMFLVAYVREKLMSVTSSDAEIKDHFGNKKPVGEADVHRPWLCNLYVFRWPADATAKMQNLLALDPILGDDQCRGKSAFAKKLEQKKKKKKQEHKSDKKPAKK